MLRVTVFADGWSWHPDSLPHLSFCLGPLNVEIWMHTEIKAIHCVAKKKKFKHIKSSVPLKDLGSFKNPNFLLKVLKFSTVGSV